MCGNMRRNLSGFMGWLFVGMVENEYRIVGQSISATQIKLYDSHLNSSRENLYYSTNFLFVVRQSVGKLHSGNQVRKNVPAILRTWIHGYCWVNRDIDNTWTASLQQCHCTSTSTRSDTHYTTHLWPPLLHPFHKKTYGLTFTMLFRSPTFLINQNKTRHKACA